jgi:hypothetical protein
MSEEMSNLAGRMIGAGETDVVLRYRAENARSRGYITEGSSGYILRNAAADILNHLSRLDDSKAGDVDEGKLQRLNEAAFELGAAVLEAFPAPLAEPEAESQPKIGL